MTRHQGQTNEARCWPLHRLADCSCDACFRAERSDAGRFIVHADQELPAFLELESAIKTDRHNHACDCLEPDEELGRNR